MQAVAVVDDATDALVGNLSETDIMLLKPDAFGETLQLETRVGTAWCHERDASACRKRHQASAFGSIN